MVAGFCDVGDVLSPLGPLLAQGQTSASPPSGDLRVSSPAPTFPAVAVSRSDGGELPLSGGGAPGAPLCPLPAQGQAAASPPAERREMGNGDYAQVSSGGVERAVRWVAGAAPPPSACGISPPQGGRVERAMRGLASAPGAPLCLRHLPPPSGGRGETAVRWVAGAAPPPSACGISPLRGGEWRGGCLAIARLSRRGASRPARRRRLRPRSAGTG